MELREITVKKNGNIYEVAIHYDIVTKYRVCTHEEVCELIDGNKHKTTFVNHVSASDFTIER